MQLANMSLKEQFEQIESLRKQKKLSVDSLCYSSNVHQSTYYRIKKNKVSPKYETLQKLVKALND